MVSLTGSIIASLGLRESGEVIANALPPIMDSSLTALAGQLH
jgi:hypothetical protein